MSGDWSRVTPLTHSMAAQTSAPESAAQRNPLPQAGHSPVEGRAAAASESASSVEQRRVDIRSHSATGAQASSSTAPAAVVTEAHRLAVQERVPTLGRVGTELAASCLAEFERRGGTALAASSDPQAAKQLNALAGEIVFDKLKSHFREGPKTSNWRYAADAPVPDEKRLRRERNADTSGVMQHEMDDRGAPLEEYLAKRVGNCQTQASAAVAMARSLGVPANIWHFINAGDREGSDGELIAAHTHATCVIGQVPSTEDPNRPARKYDRTGHNEASHLFMVDTWSGVKGPGDTFREAYRQQMHNKDAKGKLIALEVEAGSPGKVQEELVRPAGKEWMQMTVDSGFTMRKDTEPDPKYRPE